MAIVDYCCELDPIAVGQLGNVMAIGVPLVPLLCANDVGKNSRCGSTAELTRVCNISPYAFDWSTVLYVTLLGTKVDIGYHEYL